MSGGVQWFCGNCDRDLPLPGVCPACGWSGAEWREADPPMDKPPVLAVPVDYEREARDLQARVATLAQERDDATRMLADTAAAYNAERSRADAAEALVRWFGERHPEAEHLNDGACPDRLEGFDTRDPDCPACRALPAPRKAS